MFRLFLGDFRGLFLINSKGTKRGRGDEKTTITMMEYTVYRERWNLVEYCSTEIMSVEM